MCCSGSPRHSVVRQRCRLWIAIHQYACFNARKPGRQISVGEAFRLIENSLLWAPFVLLPLWQVKVLAGLAQPLASLAEACRVWDAFGLGGRAYDARPSLYSRNITRVVHYAVDIGDGVFVGKLTPGSGKDGRKTRLTRRPTGV